MIISHIPCAQNIEKDNKLRINPSILVGVNQGARALSRMMPQSNWEKSWIPSLGSFTTIPMTHFHALTSDKSCHKSSNKIGHVNQQKQRLCHLYISYTSVIHQLHITGVFISVPLRKSPSRWRVVVPVTLTRWLCWCGPPFWNWPVRRAVASGKLSSFFRWNMYHFFDDSGPFSSKKQVIFLGFTTVL